jgi:ribosomal protein S18 acetylase RimI-like enzyme
VTVEVRQASPDELPAVAALVADGQRRPEDHVGAFGLDEPAVTEQVRALAGQGETWVAVDDLQLVGVLAAEWDDRPPRVWWLGPMVVPTLSEDERHTVADQLYRTARPRLPAAVTEEELAPDERNRWLAAFAARHGFHRDVASAVLTRPLEGPVPVPDLPGVVVGPWRREQRAAVVDLHDRLFPAAHVRGDRLDHGLPGRAVLVADADGDVLGYAVTEPQEDGDGYLDLVGVAAAARGRGVGTLLVAAASEQLRRDHRCPRVHLTVRLDRPGAGRLYQRAGFVEERVLVPWRRGFTVPG